MCIFACFIVHVFARISPRGGFAHGFLRAFSRVSRAFFARVFCAHVFCARVYLRSVIYARLFAHVFAHVFARQTPWIPNIENN